MKYQGWRKIITSGNTKDQSSALLLFPAAFFCATHDEPSRPWGKTVSCNLDGVLFSLIWIGKFIISLGEYGEKCVTGYNYWELVFLRKGLLHSILSKLSLFF